MSHSTPRPFDHPCFQTYGFHFVPLGCDLFLMDEIWMDEWAAEWLKTVEDQGGDSYSVGYISNASATALAPAGIEISWYPNTHDRFHEVKTTLPRDAFIVSVITPNYERRQTIFVKSSWLRGIHLRSNSVFAIIDAADMTKEIERGRLSRDKLIDLRDAIDALAAKHTDISFISFADSLLIKTNWVVGMVGTGVTYTYRPENLILLFREIRVIYRAVLKLDVYGVYAQGSNEYYDDALTHTSRSGNHISLNSLGLPFAQIMQIEQAARNAIRRDAHGRKELYLDEDFFRSLHFKDHSFRETVPAAPYKPKMTSSVGSYYHVQCDDLIAALQPATL